MSKYKVGDKVRIRRNIRPGSYGECWCTTSMAEHAGEVVTIRKVCEVYRNRFYIKENLSNCCDYWQWSDEMVEPYVEEKKVFTKSDLKNGDVVVLRNGDVQIAIVDLGLFITRSGFNRIKDWDESLKEVEYEECEWDIVQVFRPTEDWHCQFNSSSHGTLVYDRERDTKKLYNGKVVCISLNGYTNAYTVGKIYEFKNGCITDDSGYTFGKGKEKFYTFEDFAKFTASKFIEVVE